MNEASAKAESSEDDAEGVHRLRDIVVEEVSLVDRAANKRRFLIVKRSGDMADENSVDADVEKAKKKPTTGDVSDAEDEQKRKKPAAGDADEAEKARTPSDDDEEDADDKTEKAKEPPKDDEEPEGAKKAPKRKQALAIPAAVKEAILRALTEALERLMALANSIKDASEPEEDDDASMPEGVSDELAAIAELLAGIDKRKTEKRAVAKAGARMAKDRLDRFQKALTLLADILKELTDSKDVAGPSAGAAEAGVKKRDASATPPVVPGLTELVTGIGELTKVVKRQEEELARIRQARGVSNAIPVDGGRRPEPQDVSWPLDMNRPISRDQVKKEVSFFDE